MVDLRHLSTFVAVAEEGSFSGAATRLRMAQSAVSRTIRDLERDLGKQLFDRSTHHVALTQAGHATLDSARTALAAVDTVRLTAGDAGDCIRCPHDGAKKP
ncbi:LysR family transcriptional regulator [Paractinoplanes atraurantiacus]|uniref:Regulatory helix-turn-helix protein, lysR family n=1 Tax=Paractinoplanes atraurantiacus TaxID=1036182 RepID=A0A285HRX7_9ACTN|nr:LysR family transcriptional regulator [Actinoplanes atraurantiacus]SNY37566.1 regulatory helix-turn-helix protein, lysR family [Actinoplanes atraurantiacus]